MNMTDRARDLLKVNTIEIVLLHKTHNGSRERGTVISRTDGGGEVLRASPATDGEQRFSALLIEA